jgi:DNA repair photolyase
MPRCGSQVSICDVPVRFDTYKGCSHDCRYCFVSRKRNIAKVSNGETQLSLRRWIEGKRDDETRWVGKDWKIPLHWGGMSDPFQPFEREAKNSLRCLEVFAETQYPFLVSTKGSIVAEKKYLELLEKCNCLVQISLVSPQFDRIERGAPSFKERIEMIRKLTPRVKRVNVRIQPYMRECLSDILEQLELYKEIGVYGVTVEAMKFLSKKRGLIKNGADFVYPKMHLERDFKKIKYKCHELGLKFYAGENRLRSMGDDLCCCGIDGMEGFKANKANLNHFIFNKDEFCYTDAMKEKNTSKCFKASLGQNTKMTRILQKKSFSEVMNMYLKDKKSIREYLG